MTIKIDVTTEELDSICKTAVYASDNLDNVFLKFLRKLRVECEKEIEREEDEIFFMQNEVDIGKKLLLLYDEDAKQIEMRKKLVESEEMEV